MLTIFLITLLSQTASVAITGSYQVQLTCSITAAAGAVSCSITPGSAMDAGAADAGQDAGWTDAGVSDAGTNLPDAGGPPPVLDAGAPDAGTTQWVMGYLVGYQLQGADPTSQVDWSALTHIAFSPLLATADGGVNTAFDDVNGTGPQDAVTIALAAHAHGVKALMMLGGSGNGQLIANAVASNLSGFVSAMLGAMDSLGYDGIDLDWEDHVNLTNLVALAQALRSARPGIILTYPAIYLNANYSIVNPLLVTLAQSLDHFWVMTYADVGIGGGWNSWFSSALTGESPSTPVAIDDNLARFAAAGIPKAKLGMGIGFFAVCYPTPITGPRQSTTNASQGFVNGGDNNFPLHELYQVGGILDTAPASSVLRDSQTSNPYLSFSTPNTVTGSTCGAGTQYVPYEDETSIIAKGQWSRANGYGGAMVWTLSQGWLMPGSTGGRVPNALMQALRTGFLQ